MHARLISSTRSTKIICTCSTCSLVFRFASFGSLCFASVSNLIPVVSCCELLPYVSCRHALQLLFNLEHFRLRSHCALLFLLIYFGEAQNLRNSSFVFVARV